MKNILLMAGFLCVTALPAGAQERQVYSMYPTPNFSNNSQGGSASDSQSQQPNRYMTYPGREQYGDQYGYMPRHPGDYRDAVDRGQWEGGGGARLPRRSSYGY